MYARTEHWISDYAFFDDEVRFLINVLDWHFVETLMSDSARIGALRSAARKLLELDRERESVTHENKETLVRIARLIKGEMAFDPLEFREEYADIENAQVGFLKRYRAIKKEIFDLSAQLQRTSKV